MVRRQDAVERLRSCSLRPAGSNEKKRTDLGQQRPYSCRTLLVSYSDNLVF